MNHPIVLGQIVSLSPATVLDQMGSPIHRYFHATFNFRTPPFTKIPVYLEGYDVKNKTFRITVLTDKTTFDVGLEYPLIPITEESANDIVAQRLRGKNSSSKSKSEVEPTRLVNDPGIPELSESNAPDLATPKERSGKKKQVPPQNPRGNRPSMSEMIITAIGEDKSMDEIVGLVAKVYPEKEEKKIRSLVSCHRSRIKWHAEHPEGK